MNERRLLLGALERMDRARNILTDGNPRPDCNWGMLDTADIRAALQSAPGREAAKPAGWVDDGGTVFWHDGKPPADDTDLYTTPSTSATVEAATIERIAALLHEEATDEPWTVAGVEHNGPDRGYYRKLARKVVALASQPAQPQASAVYAVPTDQTTDDGKHVLYTITDNPIPLADNWKLYTAQPQAEAQAGETPLVERTLEQALANAERIRLEYPHYIQPNVSDRDMILLADALTAQAQEIERATAHLSSIIAKQGEEIYRLGGENTELREKVERLEKVIRSSLRALELANETGLINDTIWMHGPETLFDYMSSAIEGAKP